MRLRKTFPRSAHVSLHISRYWATIIPASDLKIHSRVQNGATKKRRKKKSNTVRTFIYNSRSFLFFPLRRSGVADNSTQMEMGSHRRLDRDHLLEAVPRPLRDTRNMRQLCIVLFPREPEVPHGQTATRGCAGCFQEDLRA